MCQNLTNKFNEISSDVANMQVHHERDPRTNAYTGRTNCIISFIHDGKPRSVYATAQFNFYDEDRPMTKAEGYRIATERAIKRYFKFIAKDRDETYKDVVAETEATKNKRRPTSSDQT